MAEGLAKAILGKKFEIKSAGSNPTEVNPLAIEAMKELGIDISQQYSKSTAHIDPKFLEELDYVITLCAEEVCPVLPTKAKRLHWGLPDPATAKGTKETQLQVFREVRESIQEQLQKFRIESK